MTKTAFVSVVFAGYAAVMFAIASLADEAKSVGGVASEHGADD